MDFVVLIYIWQKEPLHRLIRPPPFEQNVPEATHQTLLFLNKIGLRIECWTLAIGLRTKVESFDTLFSGGRKKAVTPDHPVPPPGRRTQPFSQ